MEQSPEKIIASLKKQVGEKPLTPEEKETLKIELNKGNKLIASDREEKIETLKKDENSVVTPIVMKDAKKHEIFHQKRTREENE